jgi:stage IV sporulation protein FB
MFGTNASRDNPINWSLTLGHVAGIRVRLHLLFLLFVGLELLTAARRGEFTLMMTFYGMLFGIVFLHEMGHCKAARSVGGQAYDILMWPLGGLASVRAPNRPWPQLITTVGGPAVNFAFCIISAILLMALAGSVTSVPWNPLAPIYVTDSGWGPLLLAIFFKVNYILLLFNLLPMYPLDGGRLLQAILWFRMGYYPSLLAATTVGMVGAIALGMFGLLTEQFLVVGIAVFGYLYCMQQRQFARFQIAQQGEQFMGYDYSGGYTTFEETGQQSDSPGFWARRKAKRAARRREREERIRRLEEEEVDAILAKVREKGVQSLTRHEKRILEEATARRQSKGHT